MNDQTICACVKCKQKLRVPSDIGTLTLTCPKCREVFLWINPSVMFQSNTPEELLEILKPIVKETPCDPTIHYNIGLTYSKLHRYEEAIESYKKAIDFNTEMPEVYLYLGIAYGHLEKHEDSINALEKAKQLIPNDEKISCSLAIEYCKSGNSKKGIVLFKEAIKINPNNTSVLGCLGEAYDEAGNHKDAIKTFKQIVEREPNNAKAHHSLGVSYISVHDLESAREEYDVLKNIDEDLAKNLIDNLEPREIGCILSERLKKFIESIPNSLSSVYDGKVFDLNEISEDKLTRELTILTHVGQRLALQVIGIADRDKRKAILDALDEYASEFLESSPEFDDLMDKRGEQYFQLLQPHLEQICNGEGKKFVAALQFKFEQFCLGGGDEEQRIVLGRWSSVAPLSTLILSHWSEGFIETAKYVDERCA